MCPTPSFRPDLNFEDQVASYNVRKWNKQAQYMDGNRCIDSMSRETSSDTPHHKRVAIKILLTEAHWLHQRREVNVAQQDPILRKRWTTIANRAMKDLRTTGPQNVIRNLSCMCIFVEGRQAEVYGEHEMDRTRRITMQCDMLNKLHMQRLQGWSGVFLKES